MPLEKITDPIAMGLEQLTVAIDLFIDERSYVSALVLAMAAEEIFQRALKQGGRVDVLSWEFEFFDEIGLTPRRADEGQRLKEFRRLKRAERNFANHGPDNRQGRGRADFRPLKEVAEEAIERALTNLHCLNIPRPDAADRFHAWALEHIVGFEDPPQ